MAAQTGPAIRMDQNIIEKHEEMLSRDKDFKQFIN